MNGILFNLIAFCCTQITAQVATPVFQWEYATAVSSDAKTCISTSDDLIVGAFSSLPGGSAILMDYTGSILEAEAPEDVEWVEPVNVVINNGERTYFFSSNEGTNQTNIRIMENTSLSFVFHNIDWTSLYSDPTVVAAEITEYATYDRLTILIKVFNNTTNKWQTVLHTYDYSWEIEEISWVETIWLAIASKNTYPVEIILAPSGKRYIWGYYDKNVAGSNHDLFLNCYSIEGSLIFSKTFASFASKDDIAFDLVSDASGNLYGISSSEDDVAPYSKHIAVQKLNPNNGKRLWIKRIGYGTAGSEAIYSASGNTLGDGIAFGGSSADGGGGRNGKIWRLNSGGTTLWVKTINLEGTGSMEECRTVAFHPENGNVYSCNISQGILAIYCQNASTGANIWSPVIYEGDGSNLWEATQMEFSSFHDIIISSAWGDDLDPISFRIIKFSEMEVRSESELSKPTLMCFPNPADDYLQITGISEDCLLQIFNLSGQLVMEQYANAGMQTIQVETLPEGNYTMVLIGNSGKQQIQFSKVN